MVTPNDIEVLLHYHVSPMPCPRATAPTVIHATTMLLNAEMIVPAVIKNNEVIPKPRSH